MGRQRQAGSWSSLASLVESTGSRSVEVPISKDSEELERWLSNYGYFFLVLAEDPGSSPSTHMVVSNFNSSSRGI